MEQERKSPMAKHALNSQQAEGEYTGKTMAPPPFQLMASDARSTPESEPQKNNTGMPDDLKAGIENLSGMSMDDVKVHRNSDQPAQLNAHAYAQGTDIHLGPGQEQHLPHEAWHVVQQKQGRVRPTTQLKSSVPVNDDAGLEKEADVMGAKALQVKGASQNSGSPLQKKGIAGGTTASPAQLLKLDTKFLTPKRSTIVENEEIKPGESLVTITKKSFALMPGMNHHMLHVEEWGNNANDPSEPTRHLKADFNPIGAANLLDTEPCDGLIKVDEKNGIPTSSLPSGASVVKYKSVPTNTGKLNTLRAMHGLIAGKGYKMFWPDTAHGVNNCQTWAQGEYDRL